MSKVLYSATMSLDGYIAGLGGDMSWLRPYLQPNPPVEALQQKIRALLVGGRTHRGDDPHRGTDQEGAFEGTWVGPILVVTRQPSVDEGDVHFVDGPRAGLEARQGCGPGWVRQRPRGRTWRECLDLGEVDEVLTIIAPVLLGGGTPLFAHPKVGRYGWNGWTASTTARDQRLAPSRPRRQSTDRRMSERSRGRGESSGRRRLPGLEVCGASVGLVAMG